MRVAAIIVAAGRGARVGANRPKQFLEIGHGKSMLDMSIDAVSSCGLVDEIIVALPPGWQQVVEDDPALLSPERARPRRCPLVLVEGGERRQDSVARALARVTPQTDLVVIHDAARPFVRPQLIEATIRMACEHGAAIAAVPAIDTVKQTAVAGADGTRIVRRTLSRETIYLAQTPQSFRRDVLAEAMTGADAAVTDEAMLVERAGFAVHIVDGDATNVKVTSADDLARARGIVAARDASGLGMLRIGTGYDLHRLVEGRALVLAGVRVPFERGLTGHSDADIVCHAVTDAILGAAGAGDIGRLFPDTDPRWKDADSLELLQRAADVVRRAGYRVGNVDVTVIAERPKLLPYLDAMRTNLAGALGTDESAIGIKGKTNEGVGATGRGEAMACHAVALLARDG